MALAKDLKSLHQNMFDELFSKITTESGLSPTKTRVVFASAGLKFSESMRRTDSFGKELNVIEASSVSPVTGMSLTSVTKGRSGISYKSRNLVQAEAAKTVLQKLSVTSPGVTNIIMSWDKDLQGATMEGLLTGVQVPINVPVKKIFNRYFGDLGLKSSKLQDIVADAKKSTANDAIRYLRQSIELHEAAHGPELTPSQMVSAVFNAAFMRAREADQNSPYGLKFFRDTLQNLGVVGLSVRPESIFSTTDPYGISDVIAGIKPGAKDRAYLYLAQAADVHEAGSMKTQFFEKVGQFYGGTYAKRLEDVYTRLHQSAGNELTMALSHHGGVFIGKHGDLSSFRPLAAEVMSHTTAVSSRGIPTGMITIGNKQFSGRKIYSEGGERFLSEYFLGAFETGATRFGAGLNARSIAGSIAKAKRYATAEAIVGMTGAHFQDLRQPLVSRGKFAMYSALYDSHTFAAGPSAYAAYQQKFKELSNAVINGLLTAGEADSLRVALEEDFRQSMHTTPLANKLYPAVKGKIAIERGLIPLPSIADIWLPKVMESKRAMTKGLYGARGTEERWNTLDLKGLKRSREAAGFVSRASTMGVTSGNMRMMHALHKAYAPGSVIGNLVGASSDYGAITFPVYAQLTGMRGPYSELLMRERGFGDAGGFLLSPGGMNVFARSRPTVPRKEIMNTYQLKAYLLELAGDKASSPEWSEFLAQDSTKMLAGGVRKTLQLPLPNKGAFPQGAKYLTGISGSLGRADVAFYFGTGESSVPGVSAFMLNQMTRMSVRRISHTTAGGFGMGMLEGLTGVTSGATPDIVTSTFNVNPKDPTNIFYHRTGLLSTVGGSKLGTPAQFASMVNEVAGAHVLRYSARGEGYLRPGPEFTHEQFKTASAIALKKLGFSGRQISGKKFGITLPGGGRMAGTSDLIKESPTVSPRSALASDWGMFLGATLRTGESDDFQRDAKAFRVRLNTLASYAQSTKALGYMTPFDHPLVALMAYHFERSSDRMFGTGKGIRFNRGNTAKNSFIKRFPEELLRMFSPYKQNYNAFGADVLSLKQVHQRFGTGKGGINLSMVTRSGDPIMYEDILQTTLFSDENTGFVVDLGDEINHPVNAKTPMDLGKGVKAGQKMQAPEPTVRSRYVSVPSGKILREQFLHGKHGNPISFKRGDVLHSIVGLINAANFGLTEKGSIPGTAQRYAQELTRGYARFGGKEGQLADRFFSANWEDEYGRMGAGRGRIAPQVMYGNSYKAYAQSLGAGVEEAMYHVGVSEDLIRSSIGNKQEADAIINMLTSGKTVYAGIQPTPVHSLEHLRLVKLKLDNSLRGYQTREKAMGISGFLQWILNRDNDKDVIDYLIMGSRNMKILKAQGFKPKDFDKMFKAQITRDGAGIYKDYRESLRQASDVMEHLGSELDDSEIVKRYTALFSFGKIASLPFSASYPNFSLASVLTQERDPQKLAEILNKTASNHNINLRHNFSADDVATYAEKIGGRGGLARAHIYHMSIFQSAVLKASEFFPTLMDRYMSIQSQANEAYAKGVGLEEFQQHTQTGIQELLDKMGYKFQVHTAVTGAEISRRAAHIEAAKTLGQVIGGTAWMRAKHHEPNSMLNRYTPGFPDLIHNALSSMYGTLSKIVPFLFGTDEMLPIEKETIEKVPTSQQLAAEGNLEQEVTEGIADRTKAMSRQVRDFFMKYWKPIGIGAGVLIAARTAHDILTADYLRPPNPAPFDFGGGRLPPEPHTERQQPGPVFQGQRKVYIANPHGRFSNDEFNGASSSANINTSRNAIAYNMNSLNNLHTSVNIADSRSHINNYQMSQYNNMHEDSDYIHRYM